MSIWIIIAISWLTLGFIGACLLTYDHYRVGLDTKVSDVFTVLFGAITLGPIVFLMGLSTLKIGDVVLIRGKNARG